MRFLRVILGALLLLVLVIFAVANRQGVAVSLDPLPFAVELPLYLLVFITFIIGLLLGAFAHWLGRLGRKPPPATAPGAKPPRPLVS
ncbi:MAG: LapA family protein [Ferrovibrio sp.]|nr:LapA family protein [Ferrovibrio sp.]